MPLNDNQLTQLLKPINPKRVLKANGQSHVPAYDVAAHLTRILGFGNWDTEILTVTNLFETSELKQGRNGKPDYIAWTVGYAATLQLTIKDLTGTVVAVYQNGACGDAVNQPSRADAHHLAMTTAISTAMKRCAAFGLGDQFGLSLYNKGATSALIGSLVGSGGDVEANLPEPQSLGNDEREASGNLDNDSMSEFSDPHEDLRNAFHEAGWDNPTAKAFCEKNVGRTISVLADLSDSESVDVFKAFAWEISEGLDRDEA